MFGFEQSGITPVVITLSKGIGGGLPLAVMVYNDSLDTWQPGAHAGTFRGNQLAMAAGTINQRRVRQIPRACRYGWRALGKGVRLLIPVHSEKDYSHVQTFSIRVLRQAKTRQDNDHSTPARRRPSQHP
jgi:glutamate-1-semialdehyde aminotransferase